MTTETRPENRRKSERVDAKIQVKFRSQQEFSACYSQNLSKGGIYLETESLPDPNAVIELDLEIPASSSRPQASSVSLRGRIVRLMSVAVEGKKVHKVAIQFIDVPPHIQFQIDALYEELAK